MYPSNMEDLGEKGIKDEKYQELIRFVEGAQEWKTAPPHIVIYKSNISEIGVEKVGKHKLLVFMGKKIIPPYCSRK